MSFNKYLFITLFISLACGVAGVSFSMEEENPNKRNKMHKGDITSSQGQSAEEKSPSPLSFLATCEVAKHLDKDNEKAVFNRLPKDLHSTLRDLVKRHRFAEKGILPKECNTSATIETVLGEFNLLETYQLLVEKKVLGNEGDQVTAIESMIEQFKKVKRVNFFSSNLNKVPECFKYFQNVTMLNLNMNPISPSGEFPCVILTMKSIEKLLIMNTGIKELPVDLGKQLPNLKHLNIQCNDMPTLQDDIIWPEELLVLDASSNRFTTVPASLFALKNFRRVGLSGNPNLMRKNMPRNTDWNKVRIQGAKK